MNSWHDDLKAARDRGDERRWENLERVSASPRALQLLHDDLGTYYRKVLDAHLNGDRCIHEDLFWIDRLAAGIQTEAQSG